MVRKYILEFIDSSGAHKVARFSSFFDIFVKRPSYLSDSLFWRVWRGQVDDSGMFFPDSDSLVARSDYE